MIYEIVFTFAIYTVDTFYGNTTYSLRSTIFAEGNLVTNRLFLYQLKRLQHIYVSIAGRDIKISILLFPYTKGRCVIMLIYHILTLCKRCESGVAIKFIETGCGMFFFT